MYRIHIFVTVQWNKYSRTHLISEVIFKKWVSQIRSGTFLFCARKVYQLLKPQVQRITVLAEQQRREGVVVSCWVMTGFDNGPGSFHNSKQGYVAAVGMVKLLILIMRYLVYSIYNDYQLLQDVVHEKYCTSPLEMCFILVGRTWGIPSTKRCRCFSKKGSYKLISSFNPSHETKKIRLC